MEWKIEAYHKHSYRDDYKTNSAERKDEIDGRTNNAIKEDGTDNNALAEDGGGRKLKQR